MRFVPFVLPWLELFTLIQLGISTSAVAALGYVFVTFVVGFLLLRREGQSLISQLSKGQPLSSQLSLDDMGVGFAGLLLMIPGLITDVFALFVLLGPLRRRLVRRLRGSTPQAAAEEDVNPRRPEIIEGEYRRVDSGDDK